MFVIGLTGGIGTGKSEVARLLRQLGAEVLDADRLGHEVYRPGTEGWRRVVEAFGPEVVGPDGQIDRKRLGSIVFGDPSALARLNAIVHPVMYRMMEERLEEMRRQGVRVAVLDAAILLEAGWRPLVDEVWAVVAPEEVAVERAVRRTGLDPEAIRARIRAQMPQEERVRHADAVIDNSGDLEHLGAQVRALWEARVRPRLERDDPGEARDPVPRTAD